MDFKTLSNKYKELVDIGFITFYDKDVNVINGYIFSGAYSDDKVEYINIKTWADHYTATPNTITNFRNHFRKNGYINIAKKVNDDGWYSKPDSDINKLINALYY